MRPAAPSPFLEVPEAEWVCANALCFAIEDSFPVSSGHVLVIPRRVVPKPDGYNVGFNAGAAAGQTVPHLHVIA